MLILSPADRAALWREVATSKPEDTMSMLRVLAKEIQDLLASDLDLYSGWDEPLEATLQCLYASGLIGRDSLRMQFESVGGDESEGGTSAAEFALTLAGALEESASFETLSPDTRQLAAELAAQWRELVASVDLTEAPPEQLSVAQVAAHFGVTPQAVYKWCEANKIEFTRTPGGTYRIPSAQFEWKRGADTSEARREVALRLLRSLGDHKPMSTEDMADSMRRAREQSAQ